MEQSSASGKPSGEPTATVGILTVSDRASRGEYEDRGGPRARQYIEEHFDRVAIEMRLVPDEQDQIERAIVELSATCGLVVTTGGTGPSPRDVTPEAAEAVCRKMMPGFGEVMRAASFPMVPTAILSRQSAGLCGSSLVITLPGNPKAIPECLDPVLLAIPPCLHHAGSEHVLQLKPEFKKNKRGCM